MEQVNQDILTTLKKEKTYQLDSSIGKTVRVTAFMLIVFMIFGEAIARQKPFQSLFVAPGIGSRHGHFEKQLGRLKRISEEEGKVDCIIIGSSTVREGFYPPLFRSSFEAKTGKDFPCFNFGVDGLAAAGAGAVVQILVEKYQPQLLIFGIEPRDFSYPSEEWANTTIINSPWVQYKLGKGNFSGWLFEHSFLLQYQEPLSKVLHLQFYRDLRRYTDYTEEAKWGYHASTTTEVTVSMPPNQHIDSQYVREYYELLYDYQMLPENLEGFRQVLDQQKNGVQVLAVEMPVAPGYKEFFAQGDLDYEAYTDQISEYLNSGHVPFLRTQSDLSIPVDGWWDYNHLNEKGAMLFTEWLAMKVGKMLMDGTISPLVP